MTSSESGDSLVRLNVGGSWYTTTRNTLLAQPDTIFYKMLQDNPNMSEQSDKNKERGYYFIDRDGGLFSHVLNYLRSAKLNLPATFTDYAQLLCEARFYGLHTMEKAIQEESLFTAVPSRSRTISSSSKSSAVASLSPGSAGECAYIEVSEAAHPEKMGVCGARLIVRDEHLTIPPLGDALNLTVEVCHGDMGRMWISTDLTRLDWAERLTSAGWQLQGTTSFLRRLPDITGRGSDLCHVIDKWSYTTT